MKSLLICLAVLIAAPTFAYDHTHSSETAQWAEDALERWQSRDALIPISIGHRGETTDYYIEVNDRPVTHIFQMSNEEMLSVDVPVTLDYKYGAQVFLVCSVSLTDTAGSKLCSEVALYNINPEG